MDRARADTGQLLPAHLVLGALLAGGGGGQQEEAAGRHQGGHGLGRGGAPLVTSSQPRPLYPPSQLSTRGVGEANTSRYRCGIIIINHSKVGASLV